MGISQQGMAKQIQTNIKFDQKSFGNKYEIVQKSIYQNGKWIDIIPDKSVLIERIINKIPCN